MAFEDVYLVSEKLILTPEAELDELQGWLSAPLPHGYREYMTTLGVGTYCDLVQILTPARIRKVRDERRQFVREYYRQFWGASESSLSLDEAVAGVFFASTCDGDEMYYLPAQERLFILPRHNDVVFWLEAGFADPLDWRSARRRANIFRPPFRYFEPAGETGGSLSSPLPVRSICVSWLSSCVSDGRIKRCERSLEQNLSSCFRRPYEAESS
jgi:hypothetical protein